MRNFRWIWFTTMLGVTSALIITGCSGDGLRLAKVSGSVKVDGQPLANGKIILIGDGGRQSVGRIVAGEIKNVTTLSDGDGAVVGSNRVAIRATVDQDIMMKEPRKAANQVRSVGIPEDYSSTSKTKLIVEIKAGEDNSIDIDIKSE